MIKGQHLLRKIGVATSVLLFTFLAASIAWADILFITNPQTEITTLSRQELRAIYLNQRSTWPNGMEIKLTMLNADETRQEFCQEFLDKSAAQFERHLRRQLYTGKALPPVELKTADAVINYIRTTPGALGFVPAQPQPKGVVVLNISP